MRCRFSKGCSSYHIGSGLGKPRRGLQGPEMILGQVSPRAGSTRGMNLDLVQTRTC